MKKILVVDDEPKIIQIANDYLTHAGYEVLQARDGQSALSIFRSQQPDLIILDLGLPSLDGLDVTRELRKFSTVPIIMLTARSDESDKLIGLEMGADDYITKPFSPKELVARVRSVLRRMENLQPENQLLHVGNLTLDIPRMRTTLAGSEIELTATEFQFLAVLVKQPGRIFTRGQLLEAVHGVAIDSYERAIDAHIKNIRRKIEPNPRQPRYVISVYGMGYKFNDKLTDA
jgi:DNA-binding response OmpR family regulator